MIAAPALAAWIERLESAGLDLDVTGLLDALWLAGKGVTLAPATAPAARRRPGSRGKRRLPHATARRPHEAVPEAPRPASPATSAIYQHGAGETHEPSVKASPIAVPAAPALQQTLALARALRPLRERRPSVTHQELDEEATVHATAEQLRGVRPVFAPVREPWYEAAVVVEDDPAMHVWRDTVQALVRLLERTGAFRDVRTWRLQMAPLRVVGPSGIPVRHRYFESASPKRLIFFVTHGVSPCWFDGRYAAVLEPWCRYASVLLVHLLPGHLWKLTDLGEPRALVQTVQPGQITAELLQAPLWWLAGLPPEKHRLTLPVAALEPASLGRWAQMQMARGSLAPAMVLDTRVPVRQPHLAVAQESIDYEQAVAFFRSYATTAAWDLGVALATSAFTLPVARVIQAARWSSAASHTHLAEVLLSGLVRTRTPINDTTDPNEVYYEFYPEARSILLRSLRGADRDALARDLEDYVSRYLEQQRGTPANFRALVRNDDGDFDLPAWAQPFAHLGTALLGTAHAPSPEALVERFRKAVPSNVFQAAAEVAVIGTDPSGSDVRPRIADRVAAAMNLDVDLWQTLVDHRLLAVRDDGYWEFVLDVGERLANARRLGRKPLALDEDPGTGLPRRLVIASDIREGSGTTRHAGSFRVLRIRSDSRTVSVSQQRREAIASADIVVGWEQAERNWPEFALTEPFGSTVYLTENLSDPDVPDDLLHVTLGAPLARMSAVPRPDAGAPHPRLPSLVAWLTSSKHTAIVRGRDPHEVRRLALQALWDRRLRERYRQIAWRGPGSSWSSSPETLNVVVGRDEPLGQWPDANLLLVNPDLDAYGDAPPAVRWFDTGTVVRAKGVTPGEQDVQRLLRHLKGLQKSHRRTLGVLVVLQGAAPARVIYRLESAHLGDLHDAGLIRKQGEAYVVRRCVRDRLGGAHDEAVDWHRWVLAAYGVSGARPSSWRALEDDGYIHGNLFRHAVGGRQEDLARRIAADPRWWELRLRSEGVERDLDDLGAIAESPRVRHALESARAANGSVTTPDGERTVSPDSRDATARRGPDIFLSYAHEDVERSVLLASVLEAHGWSVFRDRTIPTGERYDEVLDRQIEAARLVVVLWSRRSIASSFVKDEARRASERGVLLSVRIDDVQLPDEFRAAMAASLIDWRGDREAAGVEMLVAVISKRIGGASALPLDLNLVTGARDAHPDLGPTVNMRCRITNGGEEAAALERLAIAVTRDGQPAFDLIWHLFYNVSGFEHSRSGPATQVRIAANSVWESGVQFHEVQSGVSNIWPAGGYDFRLVGWINRDPTDSRPNLETTFRARVDAHTEGQMRRWRQASAGDWDRQQASNRALAFPLNLTDIRIGDS